MIHSLPIDEFPNLSLEPERLPRHVAIVMDGNGRWATQRSLARVEGHRRGKDSVRAVVETACDLNISYLTLFAFSSENWQRPLGEVRFLMDLLRRYLLTETKRMMKRGVRLVAVGEIGRLPGPVRKTLEEAIRMTQNNRGITVALGLSYGGRQDLLQAVRKIARKAADGILMPEKIDESTLSSHLQTANLPDPDLLIRTSGEVRLSNFSLYQLAYTELYFTETLWPDFREREFLTALCTYQRRERRFGSVVPVASPRLRAAN